MTAIVRLVSCLFLFGVSAGALQAQVAGAAAQSGDWVKVRGRVVDPNGHAVNGAQVFALGGAWDFDRPLSEARTNEQGRFEIAFKKSLFTGESVGHWKYVAVAA